MSVQTGDKLVTVDEVKAAYDFILKPAQTLTTTTDSNGRIISDIDFANVKSVNVASKIDYYCLCRQSTQGKAVFLVFNGTFQIAANTSVDLLIWLA